MKEITIKHESELYQFNYIKTDFFRHVQEMYTSVAVGTL